jgi:threonine dehydrogenase-like Zn-dependent dehydrogenase
LLHISNITFSCHHNLRHSRTAIKVVRVSYLAFSRQPPTIKSPVELGIRGSRTSAGEFEEALKLISEGTIDVTPIISKVVSLEDIPDAVKDISEYPERYLKINAVL